MPTQLILHLFPDRDHNVKWVRYDSKQGATPVASGPLEDTARQLQGAHVVVLVPSLSAFVTAVSMPTGNRQKLIKAVPYALEDQLAEDIEDYHIAVGTRRADGTVPAISISHHQMIEWQNRLRDAGIIADYVVPDVWAMPASETDWQLYIDERMALIRPPNQIGFACDAENVSYFLQTLTGERKEDQAPEPLKIWNATGTDLTFVETLTSFTVDVEPVNHLLDLAARTGIDTKESISLLQGAYSRREQFGKYLRPWRVAASLAGVWFVLQFVIALIDIAELNSENEALKAQVVKAFQQAVPDARKVVNPRVQMERKLAEFKGDGGGAQSSFLTLLGDSAQAFKDTSGVVLRSIRFKPNELDIDLEVSTIQDLDQLKQRLTNEAKLKVEIQSAASKDNKVQGRINIKST